MPTVLVSRATSTFGEEPSLWRGQCQYLKDHIIPNIIDLCCRFGYIWCSFDLQEFSTRYSQSYKAGHSTWKTRLSSIEVEPTVSTRLHIYDITTQVKFVSEPRKNDPINLGKSLIVYLSYSLWQHDDCCTHICNKVFRQHHHHHKKEHWNQD